jgi:hypothetical protein
VLAGVLWFVAGVVVPFQDFLGGLREHAFKLDTLLLLVGWLAVRRRVGAAWASGLAVWVVGAILWQAGLLYRLIDPMWLAAHVSFMSSGRAADIVPAEIVTAAVLLAPTVSGAWVAVWVDRAVRPRREAVRARREAVRQARTAAPSAPILAAAPARAGAVAARTDPFAVVSLVLAVVGLSVPAVVFGHLARSRIGESGDEGAGLATAGLVVGYVVLGLSVLAVVGLLVLPHMLGPGH